MGEKKQLIFFFKWKKRQTEREKTEGQERGRDWLPGPRETVDAPTPSTDHMWMLEKFPSADAALFALNGGMDRKNV